MFLDTIHCLGCARHAVSVGITMPKPNSRIMDIFPKNLFEVVKCAQTKNIKNQNFEFGAI